MEKKRHTIKNTIITTTDKVILFVGNTFAGKNHDYSMLKEEFPPDEKWFENIEVLADLGYLGIQTDYEGKIAIPHKKPRKSKKNPTLSLSNEQKKFNTQLSRMRIYVENAIGGAKRYKIVVDRFRNHTQTMANDAIGIASALWNFQLHY